jgi:VanZ family protein
MRSRDFPERSGRRTLFFSVFIGWTGLTFLLTSLPELPSPPDISHADKVAHFFFYGVIGLTCALWRRECGRPVKAAVVTAWVTVLILGAFDEVHQLWIPGRNADVLDWAADAAGGGIGAFLSVVLPAVFPHLRTE